MREPMQQVVVESRKKKRRTTEADWEPYRAKLERLWLDDRKTKQEIVHIMNSEDRLDITLKQLKTLFERKWKLPKNNRKSAHERLLQHTDSIINEPLCAPQLGAIRDNNSRPTLRSLLPSVGATNCLEGVTCQSTSRNVSNDQQHFEHSETSASLSDMSDDIFGFDKAISNNHWDNYHATDIYPIMPHLQSGGGLNSILTIPTERNHAVSKSIEDTSTPFPDHVFRDEVPERLDDLSTYNMPDLASPPLGQVSVTSEKANAPCSAQECFDSTTLGNKPQDQNVANLPHSTSDLVSGRIPVQGPAKFTVHFHGVSIEGAIPALQSIKVHFQKFRSKLQDDSFGSTSEDGSITFSKSLKLAYLSTLIDIINDALRWAYMKATKRLSFEVEWERLFANVAAPGVGDEVSMLSQSKYGLDSYMELYNEAYDQRILFDLHPQTQSQESSRIKISVLEAKMGANLSKSNAGHRCIGTIIISANG